MTKIKKINYSQLNARQKENYNFHKIAQILAEYGYDCLRPNNDWKGADFLAYHDETGEVLKVQLKSRVTIGKKYMTKNIYMTFPINNEWYLIRHNDLLSIVQRNTPWLTSQSWIEKGGYSSNGVSRLVISELEKYLIKK